jgi:protein tyrosine/serine phosphatase
MVHDRVIQLAGVHNFRDYGGYVVSGGGRLKRRILWRSGQHFEATDGDLAVIDSLNLVEVFDLRSDKERSSQPCRRSPAFEGNVNFVEHKSDNAAPHVVAARTRGHDPESARQSMITSYTGLPFRPKLVELLRRYLVILAETDGASLINCLAGKDRTGIAVAMLHCAVGVHPDDIMADYLLTNTAGDAEARIVAGMRAAVSMLGPIDEAAMRVIMGVEPEYLDTAFAAIREQHGSVDSYLAEVLGADDALRERLRARLVEA